MKIWYIKLHRSSEDNVLYFSEPFTKRQARTDLIMTTSFKDWIIIVRWNIIEVKRWQNWYSEDTLAKRWKWSRDKVRRFLNYLETIQQIIQQKSKIKSIITIINYEKYQSNDTTDNTTDKQQTIQQTNTIKKYKKEKEVKEINILYKLEDFILSWNSIENIRQNWKIVEWLPKTIKITEKLKNTWAKISKEYTEQEIKDATNKYIEKIEKTIPNANRDWTHRYTLFEFLTREKWLQNYINS